MPRSLSSLLVLALLAGTAAAFAVTEGLKLQDSPVAGTRVGKVFSPVCGCPTATARIAFRLRKPGRLELALLDAEYEVVRTLLDVPRSPRGPRDLVWDGRDDAGRLVPDGRYRPRVKAGGRTILLPNAIRVDTVPPRVKVLGVRRSGGRVVVRYRLSEAARGLLLVDGEQRVRTLRRRTESKLELPLAALSPGRHRLAVAAEDLAGNVSRPVSAGTVRR